MTMAARSPNFTMTVDRRGGLPSHIDDAVARPD